MCLSWRVYSCRHVSGLFSVNPVVSCFIRRDVLWIPFSPTIIISKFCRFVDLVKSLKESPGTFPSSLSTELLVSPARFKSRVHLEDRIHIGIIKTWIPCESLLPGVNVRTQPERCLMTVGRFGGGRGFVHSVLQPDPLTH